MAWCPGEPALTIRLNITFSVYVLSLTDVLQERSAACGAVVCRGGSGGGRLDKHTGVKKLRTAWRQHQRGWGVKSTPSQATSPTSSVVGWELQTSHLLPLLQHHEVKNTAIHIGSSCVTTGNCYAALALSKVPQQARETTNWSQSGGWCETT